MSNISEKTLKDLEFETVLDQIASFCISDLGKNAVKKIKPFKNIDSLKEELNQVNEYLASFESENHFPSHYFESIKKELNFLLIENSFLEPKAFLKIVNLANTVLEIVKFLRKYKVYYPTLLAISEKVEIKPEIQKAITKIITPYGELDNRSSSKLKSIRDEIGQVRAKIGISFNKALHKYASLNYLDDIKESVVDHQRVLAVQAMYRKKIKGTLIGSSKTGSIVYIAPEATLKFNREFQQLHFEEKQEIIRLLKELTQTIRPFAPIIQSYQSYLIQLDKIGAKAKYAKQINACLPTFSTKKEIHLVNAFHPILLVTNMQQDKVTVPQNILLNKNQQIIVISGPNAGGKSITLKTIGLLQLMLQSGILIPVKENSHTYFFDKILTDIGDNQSIENQLSTYSYRLKNMRKFLRQCNAKTLFLIDEFGTGSDPELGGALAEIFLEEFYQKKAFGIITTHYANLKVLANELPQVVNANMQFNKKTLEPLFNLYIGEAGSSFTFEVAQKNGIPYSLINKAKKRVETEKIRLDKTISKLQQERQKLQFNSKNLEAEKTKAIIETDNLTEKNTKIQEKLEHFYELYNNNQKMLNYGRKINDFLNTYFQTNNKKELNKKLNAWVISEKTKYLKKNPVEKVSKKIKKKQNAEIKKVKEKLVEIEKEVLQEVKKVEIRKNIEQKKKALQKANYIFKLNDKVRIIDSNACGTIDKLEKNVAFINYGVFTTKTTIEKLELVESYKK
ncbi:MAG: endonuclease MutS2 [Lutibacter sp.]